ncbi:TolC family outer membrane protein [Shimia biformata]|uniref:TolC family outer membrane protein n=1 Tax=Shimia biformata TaxID=1294299 RepID=UPI001951FE9E|nr:TolC family outer membrane protein [Shimia biformata]
MKFFGKAIAAGVTAAVLTLSAPATAIAETLADVLADAYKHSGLLEQNRAVLRAADEDVAATFALLRPVIAWSASVGTGRTRSSTGGFVTDSTATPVSVGLSAEILLWDNGATQLAVDAAKESVLSTRQSLIAVEQNVLLTAVQAFMNVLRDREFVALGESNVRVITRELRAARDRFEVGEVTRTDVAQAEARLAGSRADLAAAKGSLLASEAEFVAAVGRRPGQLVAPTRLPATAKSREDATAVSVRNHPNIKKAQHDIQTAELNVLRTEASMGPSVSLRGTVGLNEYHNSSRFSNSGSVSLNLQQTIYQGGRLTALLRQAMAFRDAERAGLHVVRHNLIQQAGAAWAQLEAANAQLQASDRQIEAARIAFDGIREEATLGARTTLDVLNAEQEVLDAEARRISNEANQYVAAYAVLAAMGLLTAEHLNLRVEQYDPEAYYNQVKSAPAYYSKQGRDLDRVLRAIGKE